MKILLWNVRWLGKPAKGRMMQEVILGGKVDIVRTCETKLTNPSTRMLSFLGTHKADQWICKDSIGASVGIMIGFDSLFILEDEWIGKYFVSDSLLYLEERKTIGFKPSLRFTAPIRDTGDRSFGKKFVFLVSSQAGLSLDLGR